MKIMETNSTNPILPEEGVLRNAAELHSRLMRPDDGAFLNSNEREEPDLEWKEAATSKILRCKKPFKIATHKIQTLKVTLTDGNNNNFNDPSVYKTSEICHQLNKQRIEIDGMQEMET